MLLSSEVDIDKIQSASSELRNCIKSIEWDLEDLEQTISILYPLGTEIKIVTYPLHVFVCLSSVPDVA